MATLLCLGAKASHRRDSILFEFGEWVNTAADSDLDAVEAFLIGHGEQTLDLPRAIRDRSQAPVIAVSDTPSLESTLAFFDSGVDDVVRKPVHPREILARAAAIRRRLKALTNHTDIGPIRVFSDGRDPEIEERTFALPRRERRILEYLVANRGRRVTKQQIFNAIYGIFDEDVEENVVESHISKLRKKLRKRLGFDPIDSKRFLGYLIDWK
jgi:DNA-binding response OmpR family regulator